MREVKTTRKLFVFLMTTTISIFMGIIASFTTDVTLLLSIVLGVSIFGACLCMYLNFRYQESKTSEIINIQKNVDRLTKPIEKLSYSTSYRHIANEKLAKIERKYESLCYDQRYSFFAEWYAQDIEKLIKNLEQTRQEEYVRFPIYKLLDASNPIHQVFCDERNDFFYAPCTCKGVGWWLKPYGRVFTEFIQNNVKNGNIKHVKRIFIYDTEEELCDPLVQLCFALHKNEV